MMRLARLLFRYKLNMDELFEPCLEPCVPEICNRIEEITTTARMEDYENLSNAKELTYAEQQPISKPLTKVPTYELQSVLKMSKDLVSI